VRTHPVDKLLEQHCYKFAVTLLQLVRFYVCKTTVSVIALSNRKEFSLVKFYLMTILCPNVSSFLLVRS
jgi:hypothetical protein